MGQSNSPTTLFCWYKIQEDLWNSGELLEGGQRRFPVAGVCMRFVMQVKSSCLLVHTSQIPILSSKFRSCEAMNCSLTGVLNALECCDQQSRIFMPQGSSIKEKISALLPRQL